MNIVFFANRFLPDIGGVELTVDRLSRQLLMLGHTVKIITESFGAQRTGCGSSPAVDELHVPLRRPFTRVLYWRWMWNHRREFASADALHFHDYGTFIHWFLPLWFVVRKPVYVMTFHGFDSWPIRLHDRMFRRISSWCMDATFGSGSYLRHYYHHRIDYTYVGAPMRAPLAGFHPRSRHVVLYIGRLAEDTQLQETVECLGRVTEAEAIACTLELVGDGPLRDTLQELASEHLTVHFHGQLDDPTLLLQRADWIITTGLLSVLDAFVFEKPALIPALTELKQAYFRSIPDITAKAIVCHDTEALRTALHTLLLSPDDPSVTEMTAHAKRYVDTLSWESIARQYIEAYAVRN